VWACQAGKDVYLEKPVSHNVWEGRQIVHAAAKYDRIVQTGTQIRSSPSIQEALAWVNEGHIGEIQLARGLCYKPRESIGRVKGAQKIDPAVDYDLWCGPAPRKPLMRERLHYDWHWVFDTGNGDLGNQGIHQMDIARWALGVDFPESASGMGGKIFFDDDQQTPDTMNVTFQYGGKAMIWEMRIWNAYGMEEQDNGVAVYGTDASIQIGRWNRRWGYKLYDNEGKLVEHNDADDESDDHMRNFIECVRTRELPAADIATGHLSAIHCHLANIVSRTGRTLAFDQETETIVGDPHANLYVKRAYRTHWSTPKGA